MSYVFHVRKNSFDTNSDMDQTVEIQNLKCSGCGTNIKNRLQALKGVDAVSVNL